MKKIVIMMTTALLTMGGFQSISAQEHENAQKKHEPNYEQKAERISAALLLNDKDAAKFKPIYVEYRNELKAVVEKYPMMPRMEKGQVPTDEQLAQATNNRFARTRALTDVQEKYYKKFTKIISERQYNQLVRMDSKQFKHVKKMRKAFKKRK